MWAKFKKRWKSIVVMVLAALPSLGWSGEHLIAHLSEYSDLKNGLAARVDANATAIQRVKETMDERAPLAQLVPVLDERTKRIDEQTREMSREIKELRSGQARIEGILEGMKKDFVALEKRPLDLDR